MDICMEFRTGSTSSWRGETALYSDKPYGSTISAGKVTKNGTFALGLILIAWLFVYISGIFPYLGSAERSERLGMGISAKSDSGGFGMSRMLLFAGQTAFIDYNVKSDTGGEVWIDIKPLTTLGYSDNVQKIRGNASGRYEFVVPSTGVYEFDHEFSLNGTGGATHYSVSWGAL